MDLHATLLCKAGRGFEAAGILKHIRGEVPILWIGRHTMNRWKWVACLILLASFLLSACSAFAPLATEDEVLAGLSERYGGTEFVILETIDGSEYERTDRPKAQLYRAAPAEDQEHPFWVLSYVRQFTRDSLPSYYGNVLEDTYAFDYFLEQFDGFLIKNNIHGFFRSENTRVDMSEYLSQNQFHSQGGHFLVYVTQENAADVVQQVFAFIDDFYEVYPYQEILDNLRLIIYFCDKANPVQDGAEAPDLHIKRTIDYQYTRIYERTYFYPFEDKTNYNDAQSVLKAINELFYGITNEGRKDVE